MSIADFGQNVDEVRRKLSEILPLVDAGQHLVEEIHSSFSSDIGELESSLDSLTESFHAIDELADTCQDSLEETQSNLTQAIESVQGEVDSFVSTLDEIDSSLGDAQEELRSTLEAARTGIEEIEGELQSEMTNVQQDLEQLHSGLEQLDSTMREQVTQLVQNVEQFSTELKADLDQAFEAIGDFMSSAEEVGTSLTEKLSTLGESASTAISGFMEQITGQQSSVTEFFTMFGSDTENLLNEGKSALADLFGQLSTSVQEDVGTGLGELVHNAVGTCVQALAAEMVENGVMIQTGVATTTALSPVLPEIAAAQKLAELINFVL